MPVITCRYCNKEVEAERKTRKYCSDLCASRYRTELPKERVCIECGNPFLVQSKGDTVRQYCSQRCAKRHIAKPGGSNYVKLCQTCGNEFDVRNGSKKFCSKNCYMRAYKGYPRERTCRRCGSTFQVLTQADTNRQYCSRSCSKTANKENVKGWINEHPEASEQYKKNQIEKHPKIWKEKQANERLAIIDLLGGKCLVCGVINPKWLHVDYIPTTRNQPYRHPRHLAYIREHREDFRLLCANHHYELTLTRKIEGTDITQ